LYPQFSKSALYNYSATPLEQELESLMYFQHLEKLRKMEEGMKLKEMEKEMENLHQMIDYLDK
jgi:hypothetical protein